MLNYLPGQFKHLVSLLPGLSPGILPFTVHLVLPEAKLTQVIDVTRDGITDASIASEAAGRLGRVIEHILAAEAVDGGNNFDRNLLNFLQGEIIKIPKTNL